MKLKVCHIFLVLLLASLLTQQAVGLDVTTTTNLVGVGTACHEVEAATEAGLGGLKFEEGFYSKALGYYNISEINYSSDFSLSASDRMNSTLVTDASFSLTNTKQYACSKNFNIKTVQAFKTYGKTEAAYSFMSDNHTSSFDLVSNVYECGKYKLMALNSSDAHTKEYLERADFCGNFTLELSSFFGSPYYPASKLNRWLECPGGAEWNTGVEEP
jgi:hypothetical protein